MTDEITTEANGAIDFSRPFMPGELTTFYFTPAYRMLTENQRLRYNQLNALYFNEQILFFERSLAENVLGWFLAQPLPRGLRGGLAQFLDEERRHSAMFAELNRRCAPELYERREFHFIRTGAFGDRLLRAVSRRPDWFSFLPWLMHLQEERALYFGRVFLKHGDSLEQNFVAAQRRHLADEIGHVHWDEHLLDLAWPAGGRWLRWINSRLLAWMIGEYFTTPIRSAPRVLAALAGEFPGLRKHYVEFCRQLRALGNDPVYRQGLYSRDNVSKTFRRFDAWPEFRCVSRVMPGYIREACS